MIKLWHFDVIAAGRLVVVDGHDDSCLAPRSKIRSSELVESWRISKLTDLEAL